MDKDGSLSKEDAAKLVTLEAADQVSDELLNKWKSNPEALSANEKVALAGYLDVYASQDGAQRFKQLMGPQALVSGALSPYGFPYAGSKEAQDAYLADHPFSMWDGRNVTTDEKAYNKANTILSIYDYHQQWADVGTPALMAAPGAVGTLASLTAVAMGSYQFGQGYAAYMDGDHGTGAANMGLGTLSILGGSAGAFSAIGGFKPIGSGAKLYPDGSFRTPDGKFASISGSPAPGTTAASQYATFLRENGMNVVGEEMVVNGPLGVRRYDIVVQDAAGKLHGIEVKSGGATKNSYQNFTDLFVNRFGADGIGKLSGKTVTSATTVYVP